MGRKLTASEETQLLKDTIRAGHELLRDLLAAIKQAKELGPGLVARFEQIHAAEMQQLANHFTAESNRHATTLNQDVQRARDMIFNQIMSGRLVIDLDTGTARMELGSVEFDDQQPPMKVSLDPPGEPQ